MTNSDNQGSRLRRLEVTLRSDLPFLRKVRRTIWLVGAMVSPTPIKVAILRLVYPTARQVPAAPIVSNAEPYLVRPRLQVNPQRARVAHLIGNFMTGGSSQLIVDLIEDLSDEYEHEILTGFLPSPPAYVGVPVREFRSWDSWQPIEAHLAASRPDLVHIHYWKEAWYDAAFGAAKRYGRPIIENVNTPVAPVIDASIRKYVFVSEFVRREFAPTVSSSEVVHPGSNLELFRRALGETASDDCLGMVYRLERDKLNDQSIDPFIEAVRQRPGTKALIVGDGPLRPSFQEAVTKADLEDAFEFTGYVGYRDLPDLYRRMSIFVAPVWQESFGQVSSFAMGMALPVAGYDIGALNEIIDDRTLLAPPGDSAGLANILLRLLDDRERRLEIGRRNEQRVRQSFTVQAMVDRYRLLYREVLSSAS